MCLLNTSGQNREMWFLTEQGLYEVLMLSRKPIAKQFKKKVKEILKTIRLTGGCVTNDELFVNTYMPFADETVKLLFKSTLKELREKNELLEQQKPLVAFANTVANASNNIDMGEMAKLITSENINLGRNRLFEILRDKKILMKSNAPYQKYIEAKWFVVIEAVRITPYGDKVFTKTLVTGLGQIKIVEMLKEMLITVETVD